MTTLPDDIARCTGHGLSECSDCLRRTTPAHDERRVVFMWPPKPIAGLICEYYLPPAAP
jgi:hypothetical protein